MYIYTQNHIYKYTYTNICTLMALTIAVGGGGGQTEGIFEGHQLTQFYYMLVFHSTFIKKKIFVSYLCKEKRQRASSPITDTISFKLLNAGNFNALCVMDIKMRTTVGPSFIL